MEFIELYVAHVIQMNLIQPAKGTPMRTTYTVIPYYYVDASNYKQCSEIVLRGGLSSTERTVIALTLIDEGMFIPFDLGLAIPELQTLMEGFPSSDDHVFHMLDLHGISEQMEIPDQATVIEKDAFVAAFARIGTPQSWDVAAAVDRLHL